MTLRYWPVPYWVALARLQRFLAYLLVARPGKSDKMSDATRDEFMTVDEFIDWAARQERGRYELVQGRVIAMAPERARHNRIKGDVYVSLRAAILATGINCTAYTDGMTVVIDEDTAREPDALVQCGKPIDPDSLIADRPMVVVEVTSPSSERDDTTAKLSEYFSVASIEHYLIVDAGRRVVIHHARQDDGSIRTLIQGEGELSLAAPGLTLSVADLLPPEEDAESQT